MKTSIPRILVALKSSGSILKRHRAQNKKGCRPTLTSSQWLRITINPLRTKWVCEKPSKSKETQKWQLNESQLKESYLYKKKSNGRLCLTLVLIWIVDAAVNFLDSLKGILHNPGLIQTPPPGPLWLQCLRTQAWLVVARGSLLGNFERRLLNTAANKKLIL